MEALIIFQVKSTCASWISPIIFVDCYFKNIIKISN
jgi:hypothetical protein